MSSAFEGFAGFSIHEDGAENIAARKTKRDDLQGRPPANKRAALGTITNAGNTRIQPHRAAKLGVGSEGIAFPQQQENVFSKGGKGIHMQTQPSQTQSFGVHSSLQNPPQQHFSIFVDEPECENVTELHPSVTALRPLSLNEHINKLIEDHSPNTDSPMLLDESCARVPIDDSDDESEESRLKKVVTVPEYSDEIYTYLREAELRNRPKPAYMRKQPDITVSMRSILVDWLVEVAEEYKLHRETLCLSVNYIDRFLSQMSVVRGKLQLVGAASMFLAAKYEEIYPPEVGEFVYITDDTYSKKQVLRMEHLVLKVLSFDVAIPTFNCFSEKFLHDQGADDQTSALAMYLGELTMVEAEPFLNYLPSVIAASSLCLANITLEHQAWSQTMIDATGYRQSELQDCMQHLYNAFCRAPSHPQQAVREKYKQDKYHQVSMLTPPPMLPVMN